MYIEGERFDKIELALKGLMADNKMNKGNIEMLEM